MLGGALCGEVCGHPRVCVDGRASRRSVSLRMHARAAAAVEARSRRGAWRTRSRRRRWEGTRERVFVMCVACRVVGECLYVMCRVCATRACDGPAGRGRGAHEREPALDCMQADLRISREAICRLHNQTRSSSDGDATRRPPNAKARARRERARAESERRRICHGGEAR